MIRPQSSETLIITFYDIDLPQHQAVRSWRINRNTTLQDCKTYIVSSLDDNYEIYFFLENNQHFTGSMYENAWSIVKKLNKRQICYRKVQSNIKNSNYGQNLQNTEQSKQNYEIQKSNYYDNKQEQFVKSRLNQSHQQEKMIKIVAEEQTSNHYPSNRIQNNKNNYASVKIDSKSSPVTFPSQSQNMIQANNQIKQEIQNKIQHENQTPHNDLQQQNHEITEIKLEKQKVDQQNSQLINPKNRSYKFEQQIQISQVEIQNLKKENIQLKEMHQEFVKIVSQQKYDIEQSILKQQQQINEFQIKLANKEDQIKQLSMANINLVSQNHQDKTENQNLHKQISQLKQQQNDNQTEISKLNEQKEDLFNQINQFKIKLNSNEEEKRQLQLSIETLKIENNSKMNENSNLHQELSQLKQQQNNNQTEISKLNEQKEDLFNQINQFKIKLNSNEEQKRQLQLSIETLMKENLFYQQKQIQNQMEKEKINQLNSLLQSENQKQSSILKKVSMQLSQIQSCVQNTFNTEQIQNSDDQTENLTNDYFQLYPQSKDQKSKQLVIYKSNLQKKPELQNLSQQSDIELDQIKDLNKQISDSHDCILQQNINQIQELLEEAQIKQKKIQCSCQQKQLMPLNKLKEFNTRLRNYLLMIYLKQMSELIRTLRNATLLIFQCCSINCNFLFILKDGNQSCQGNNHYFCPICEINCEFKRL